MLFFVVEDGDSIRSDHTGERREGRGGCERERGRGRREVGKEGKGRERKGKEGRGGTWEIPVRVFLWTKRRNS